MPGIRDGRRDDSREAILWIWPLAALLVYFLSPGYATHALEGMSLPLSVLAVRGWQRVRWPTWLGAAAIAICTLPGLVYNVQQFRDAVVSYPQGTLLLRRGETQALAYLARSPTPGGVRQVGARYVLADCDARFNPSWLRPLVVAEWRFGCVAVYQLAVPNRALPF
jgi:hypothetical protein